MTNILYNIAFIEMVKTKKKKLTTTATSAQKRKLDSQFTEFKSMTVDNVTVIRIPIDMVIYATCSIHRNSKVTHSAQKLLNCI